MFRNNYQQQQQQQQQGQQQGQGQQQQSPLIHCSNCNKLGHYFRECTEPITSYGIIAYRVKQTTSQIEPAVLTGIAKEDTINGLDGKQIEFILIQRKDTLGYIEFMRGKYNLSDVDIPAAPPTQEAIDEAERIANELLAELDL